MTNTTDNNDPVRGYSDSEIAERIAKFQAILAKDNDPHIRRWLRGLLNEQHRRAQNHASETPQGPHTNKSATEVHPVGSATPETQVGQVDPIRNVSNNLLEAMAREPGGEGTEGMRVRIVAADELHRRRKEVAQSQREEYASAIREMTDAELQEQIQWMRTEQSGKNYIAVRVAEAEMRHRVNASVAPQDARTAPIEPIGQSDATQADSGTSAAKESGTLREWCEETKRQWNSDYLARTSPISVTGYRGYKPQIGDQCFCIKCGAACAFGSPCGKCASAAKPKSRRQIVAERSELGQCEVCGADAGGADLCDKHAMTVENTQKERTYVSELRESYRLAKERADTWEAESNMLRSALNQSVENSNRWARDYQTLRAGRDAEKRAQDAKQLLRLSRSVNHQQQFEDAWSELAIFKPLWPVIDRFLDAYEEQNNAHSRLLPSQLDDDLRDAKESLIEVCDVVESWISAQEAKKKADVLNVGHGSAG